ncbi:hypothetical protein TYRP_011136 [Tyrophagus putrescentiae]|nr:hypothetical protein TYRP_011136 [Tyrophagus putrescentiae]
MGQQPLVAALLLVHGIPKHFPDCAIELEIVVSGWKTTRQEFEKFIKWNNQENYHITLDLIRFTTNRIKICTENKGFHIDKNVFSNFLSSSKDKACDLLDTLGVMNCKRYNDKSYHQFEEFSHLYEDTHGSVNQYKENWRGINVEFCSEIAEKKKDQWNPELLHKYAIVLLKKENNRLLDVICDHFKQESKFNRFISTLCSNFKLEYTPIDFAHLVDYLNNIIVESVCSTHVNLKVNKQNCRPDDHFKVEKGATFWVPRVLRPLLYQYSQTSLPSNSLSVSEMSKESSGHLSLVHLMSELYDNYQSKSARLQGKPSDMKRFEEAQMLPSEIAPNYDKLRRFALLMLYFHWAEKNEKDDVVVEKENKEKEEEEEEKGKEEKDDEEEVTETLSNVPLQSFESLPPGNKSSSKKGGCFGKSSDKWTAGLGIALAGIGFGFYKRIPWPQSLLPNDTGKNTTGGTGGESAFNLQWIYLAGGLLVIGIIALFCLCRKIRLNGAQQDSSSSAKEDDALSGVRKDGKRLKRALPNGIGLPPPKVPKVSAAEKRKEESIGPSKQEAPKQKKSLLLWPAIE